MCLSIYRPANVKLQERILRNGFNSNSDGAGFAYAYKGKLVVDKGFFSFSEFYDSYLNIPTKAEALIHFRMASHGTVNEFNCHPWPINEDFAMIHNGMLMHFGSNEVSDTGEFTEKILTPMFEAMKNPRKDFKSLWFRYLLQQTIEKWNKINIISRWGDVVNLNEKEGLWWDEAWYSNHAGFWNARPVNVAAGMETVDPDLDLEALAIESLNAEIKDAVTEEDFLEGMTDLSEK